MRKTSADIFGARFSQGTSVGEHIDKVKKMAHYNLYGTSSFDNDVLSCGAVLIFELGRFELRLSRRY